MIAPEQFHAGADLTELNWPGWSRDDDFRRMKPGCVVPVQINGNPHHNFFSQGLLVAVLPDGSAQLLIDRRSISETYYRNGQEG